MNRIMLADSYKYSHTKQYPPNTVAMFDYAEARSGKVYDKTFFFGLQYILEKYFSKPIEAKEVHEAKSWAEYHGIDFDYGGWMYIVEKLDGKLPVKIRAVQEGLVIPTSNVLFTVDSTDPRVFWVVSWLETILMKVWYSCNVATRSWYVKQLLMKYAKESTDEPFVDYQYHNFGDRGSSSVESAAVGGMAHIAVGFMGSDNFNTMNYIHKFYNPIHKKESFELDDYIESQRKFRSTMMHSISATEHSSTTSWTKEGEFSMIMNHLEQSKGKAIIAAVLDSYDYFNAVRVICAQDGEFQRKINSKDYPIFVMRPDSGNPRDMINGTLDIMEEECVPYEYNKKGYKVFNKMRIIWGDGINEESMTTMLNILIERNYSTENIAFGSGGWLMQQHDRDTQGWAIKCSNIIIDEGQPLETGELFEGGFHEMKWCEYLVDVPVFKDPVTAPNKKSKKGKVTLWYNHVADEYFTDSIHFKTNDFVVTDMLNTVYENGEIIKRWSLDEVRKAN